MSKSLAAFYGQKSIGPAQQPRPQEYTVLGVNQPLIPPESEQQARQEEQLSAISVGGEPRKFWFSLLLSKLL